MTGVEAISDGVPAFKPPEWINARKTLTAMVTILVVTFGEHHLPGPPVRHLPDGGRRAPITRPSSPRSRGTLFGGANAAYYYIQFATMAILVLAANTAFSDFPRLAYFLARDRYMPRQFTYRGDRLAFTTGIVTLGLLAGIVLVIFGGEVEHLIPLYALGVFTSFTISQFAMFTRWQKRARAGLENGPGNQPDRRDRDGHRGGRGGVDQVPGRRLDDGVRYPAADPDDARDPQALSAGLDRAGDGHPDRPAPRFATR